MPWLPGYWPACSGNSKKTIKIFTRLYDGFIDHAPTPLSMQWQGMSEPTVGFPFTTLSHVPHRNEPNLMNDVIKQ